MQKFFMSVFDFFPFEPKLTYEGYGRFSTKFGFFTSILCGTLSVIFLFYFSTDLFFRQHSFARFSSNYNITGSLNFSELPFMIMLTQRGSNLIPNSSKYYQVGSYMVETYIDNSISYTKTKEIFFENCNIDKHFGKYKHMFQNIPSLESYYCPKPGQDINIHGSSFSSGANYSQWAVYGVRCANSTKENNCYSTEVINKFLDSVAWSMITISYIFDQEYYSDPGQIYLFTEKGQASTTMFKRSMLYLSNVDYTTDSGILFSSTKKQEYWTISPPTYTADMRTTGLYPGSFGAISLEFLNVKYNYERSYIKVQDIIANLGGFINLIFIFGKFMSNLITNHIYKMELVNSLFYWDTNKAIEFPSKRKTISINSSTTLKFISYNNNLSEMQNLEKYKNKTVDSGKEAAHLMKIRPFRFKMLSLLFFDFFKNANISLFDEQVKKIDKALCIKNILLWNFVFFGKFKLYDSAGIINTSQNAELIRVAK
jgi:hypothetical protein